MRSLRLNSLGIILALVAGCASSPRAPIAESDWQSHRLAMSELQQWSFTGKLAIRTAQGADSARLRWSQQGDDLQLEVSGPIGVKQIVFVKEDSRLRVLEGNQWRSLTAEEASLEPQLGWPLPLDLLPWWLRGLPAPELPTTEQIVTDGRLQKLDQAGWQVEYSGYRPVDGRVLPGKMMFRRGDVQGKIIFKHWTLAP
jgi:outer membrane lipoprotein LolB